ncbi:hypothetical protein A6S26_20240 [Nostoc sp. ATCC 43529]|nr:hypothetical protein A6S26_20240 [Nostoc sp. ATCC 43529]
MKSTLKSVSKHTQHFPTMYYKYFKICTIMIIIKNSRKKVVVDCETDHKVVNAGIWKKISLTMTTIQQLKQFRQGVYTILGNSRDALFDLMDAVLITRSVKSFVA